MPQEKAAEAAISIFSTPSFRPCSVSRHGIPVSLTFQKVYIFRRAHESHVIFNDFSSRPCTHLKFLPFLSMWTAPHSHAVWCPSSELELFISYCISATNPLRSCIICYTIGLRYWRESISDQGSTSLVRSNRCLSPPSAFLNITWAGTATVAKPDPYVIIWSDHLRWKTTRRIRFVQCPYRCHYWSHRSPAFHMWEVGSFEILKQTLYKWAGIVCFFSEYFCLQVMREESSKIYEIVKYGLYWLAAVQSIALLSNFKYLVLSNMKDTLRFSY